MASVKAWRMNQNSAYHPFNRKRKILQEHSITEYITRAQYTGSGFTRQSQLDEEIMSRFGADSGVELSTLPQIMSELDDMSVRFDYDDDRAMEYLKQIYTGMVNFEARRNHDHQEEDVYSKFGRVIMRHNGVEIMLRLLMYTSLLPPSSEASKDPEKRLRTKTVVIQILTRFISVKPEGEELAKELTSNDEIVNSLMELFAHEKTCHAACQLLEDLLQARTAVLNLSLVSNLKPLVACLDDKKLANFCRILAVTISDLDIYENKSSLFAQNKQKRTKGFINVRDINQELLLNIPDLLYRLVNIACDKNYTPRYREKVSELDNWMEWIEDAMSEDAFEPNSFDDLENFIGGISEPSLLNGPFTKQSGLAISMELVLRVQVVYVLGLFLVGKHRKKVQRKLAELHLVPGLSDLFDQFIWKCQTSHSNSRSALRGHRTICECSPEVALKIQFLRLVHSFCDHSEYKHLLLSKSELNEIKRINCKVEKQYQVDNVDNVNRSLMCRGSKGLLSKIVEVMKKEPTASTFRFWLARAVESYLRGSTSYCDQVFLLRRGLLQHIAGNIVEHDIRPKEILQSSFDLLGELVKFNLEAFQTFDRVFTSTDKFDKFVKVINRNLVDSNMFIRSLILSYEHLYSQLDKKSNAGVSAWGSRLLSHIANFEQQMHYLQKLISLINVQNLTQENVSCLNTTLVFLMFANKKKELPRYLRALTINSSMTGECSHSTNIMKTFRDLLVFWQDHYLHKDKDCSALEKSSRISFSYWKETVNTMVCDDTDLDSSIMHYMEPEEDSRDC